MHGTFKVADGIDEGASHFLGGISAAPQLVFADFGAVGFDVGFEAFVSRIQHTLLDQFKVAFKGSFILAILFIGAVGIDADVHHAVAVADLFREVGELDHRADAADLVFLAVGNDVVAVAADIHCRAAHIAIHIGNHRLGTGLDGFGKVRNTVGSTAAAVDNEDVSDDVLFAVGFEKVGSNESGARNTTNGTITEHGSLKVGQMDTLATRNDAVVVMLDGVWQLIVIIIVFKLQLGVTVAR